jgi:hypothetical protein
MSEDLEARVAELERKLQATVDRWNDFIDPAAGGVTRARVAELEKRISDMVETWNESVDKRAASAKKRGEEFKKIADVIVKRFERIEHNALKYRGVWAGMSAEYKRGDAVTANSALWVAHRDGPGRPGDGDSGWQLAVKSSGGA